MLSAGAIEAASAAGAIEKLAEGAGEIIVAPGSSGGSTGVSTGESYHGTCDKTIQELISSSAVPALLKRFLAPDKTNDPEAGHAKKNTSFTCSLHCFP